MTNGKAQGGGCPSGTPPVNPDNTAPDRALLIEMEKKLKTQERLFKQETARLTAATKSIAEQRVETERLREQLLMEQENNNIRRLQRPSQSDERETLRQSDSINLGNNSQHIYHQLELQNQKHEIMKCKQDLILAKLEAQDTINNLRYETSRRDDQEARHRNMQYNPYATDMMQCPMMMMPQMSHPLPGNGWEVHGRSLRWQ